MYIYIYQWSLFFRIAVPLVTRSILEVVIPEYAVPKLITKSRNKLAQISEVSLPPIQIYIGMGQSGLFLISYNRSVG